MKTIYRCILGASLLAGAFVAALRSAEPSSAVGGKAAGHVLLLDNERVLEGDIALDGDRYRIRRSMGESWVPSDKALRLCADLNEAYQFLRGRTNLGDADERLKLARWCQLHGLKEQALTEANAAVDLRPKNAEAQRLVRSLQRSMEPESTSAPQSSTGGTALASATPQAEHRDVPITLTTEALSTFSRRVQPILMNTCVSCHASESGGTFKLTRITDDGTQSRRTTQQNLTAVLGQVNLDNWPASPLLAKAISVHGDTGQAPLRGRDAPAYRALEEWVQQAAANAPPREITPVPMPTPVSKANQKMENGERRTENGERVKDAVLSQFSTQDKPADGSPVDKPKESVQCPSTGQDRSLSPCPLSSATKASQEPADPFDPLIFNRQMHPER